MLLGTLINKQRKLNLSDGAFAVCLGCSRMWWNQVKNGRQPLTKGMAIKAMRQFPDLIPEVLRYLQEGDHE